MNNTNRMCSVLLVSVLALVMGSCKNDFTLPPPPSGTPIASVLSTDANFNIFSAVIQKTGQYASLNNNNSGLVTLFAPSDLAFQTYLTATISPALPTPVTEQDIVFWIKDKLSPTTTPSIATLNNIVNYHMVSSKLTSDLITGSGQVFATLNGARLSISKQGSVVTLNANNSSNGATVTAFDLAASNGVVHTIDRVMSAIPSAANVLASYPLTISYATNPPTITGGTATDGSGANFNLFAGLLRITGQIPVILPNTTPLPDFTVFQTNDAQIMLYFQSFDATLTTEALVMQHMNFLIGTATQPGLTGTPTLANLTDLAKYNVVPGRFLSTDFVSGQTITTNLEGKTFTITITGTGPFTYTLNDQNAATDPTITVNVSITNSGILHTLSDVARPN